MTLTTLNPFNIKYNKITNQSHTLIYVSDFYLNKLYINMPIKLDQLN